MLNITYNYTTETNIVLLSCGETRDVGEYHDDLKKINKKKRVRDRQREMLDGLNRWQGEISSTESYPGTVFITKLANYTI